MHQKALDTLLARVKDPSTKLAELETALRELTEGEEEVSQAKLRAKKKIESEIRRRCKALALPTATSTALSASETGLRPVEYEEWAGASIGDANLLMSTVPIAAAPYTKALTELALSLIKQVGGTPFVSAEANVVYDTFDKENRPRLIVRWEVPQFLSIDTLIALYHATRSVYDEEVDGLKENGNGWSVTSPYFDLKGARHAEQQGIYFGPDTFYATIANGLFVSRVFKYATDAKTLQQHYPLAWLSQELFPSAKGRSKRQAVETLIELRDSGITKEEKGLGQDVFIMLLVQISSILARGAPVDAKALAAAVYRGLSRLGTNEINLETLYGMRDALSVVERTLILPFERSKEAKHLGIKPESVLLTGVPGIGKTFLEHYLMSVSHDVVFAPVDGGVLRADLNKDSADNVSSILLHTDRVRERSGLPVVLIVDEIDSILKDEEGELTSKFLNLMQGIRQKGLYLLASTNHPDKIDTRLLEPGRFSKIVYMGLPSAADRRGVMAKHLEYRPVEEGALEGILDWVVEETDGWTQRYLWQLATEAARTCLLRTPAGEGIRARISLADIESAYGGLAKQINLKRLKEWDHDIEQFVTAKSLEIGFGRG